MAADYIADVFKKNGLNPAGDSGTYLQNFRMFTARLGPGNSFRVDASEYATGSDYVPHYLSPSEDVEGPLVFVGYGIRAREHDWDDFKGEDLRGKVLLVMNNDPAFTSYFAGRESPTTTRSSVRGSKQPD